MLLKHIQPSTFPKTTPSEELRSTTTTPPILHSDMLQFLETLESASTSSAMSSQQCKEFTQSVGGERHRCTRTLRHIPPFCWQHRKSAREAANALDATGGLPQAAMLQYLTAGPDTNFEAGLINAQPHPRSTNVLEHVAEKPAGGPDLGALERPLEITQMILSELSLPDLGSLMSVNCCFRSSECHA